MRKTNYSEKELDAFCRSIQVKHELPLDTAVVFSALIASPVDVHTGLDYGRALKYVNAVFCGFDLFGENVPQPLEDIEQRAEERIKTILEMIRR